MRPARPAPRRPLARAALLALGLLLSGCLVTDFGALEEVPDDPPTENRPPHVPSSAILPSNGTCARISRAVGCRITLQTLWVVDEDVADELEARWFVDFNPTYGAANAAVHTTPLRKASLDGTQRSGTDFTFEAAGYGLGVHVVSLLVSDGFVESTTEPAQVREGKAAWATSWCVDTTDAADCL